MWWWCWGSMHLQQQNVVKMMHRTKAFFFFFFFLFGGWVLGGHGLSQVESPEEAKQLCSCCCNLRLEGYECSFDGMTLMMGWWSHYLQQNVVTIMHRIEAFWVFGAQPTTLFFSFFSCCMGFLFFSSSLCSFSLHCNCLTLWRVSFQYIVPIWSNFGFQILHWFWAWLQAFFIHQCCWRT